MGKNGEYSAAEEYVGPDMEEFSVLFDRVVSLRESTLQRYRSAAGTAGIVNLPQSQDEDPLAQDFLVLMADADRLGERTRTAIQLAKQQVPSPKQWKYFSDVLSKQFGERPIRELLHLAFEVNLRRLSRMVEVLERIRDEDGQ